MYKVFIADDEEFVIKSLIRGTNWKESGFEVIASSNDGVDAYEEILRLKPDLVFTDIRMPGMTGLELIKNVKEKLEGIQFVIISGYAEFAYAQKAMNYGAVGYCLKPFDNAEIKSILSKVKNILDNENKRENEDILYLIEDEDHDNHAETEEFFRSNGIFPEKGFTVAVTIGGKSARLFNSEKTVRLKIGYDKSIYFLQDYNDEDLVSSEFTGNVKSIGIYDIIYTVADLKNVIDETIILAYQYFISGSKWPFRKKAEDRNVEKLIISFENAMIHMDIEEIKKVLAGFHEYSQNGKMNVKHAINIYNSYVSFSSRLLGEEGYEEYIYNIDELCKRFSGMQEMLEYITTSTMNIIGRKKTGNISDIRNEYFKKIIDYINRNFYKDISIQSLSRDYALNSNYLCQLFRRELGMTFTDYLTGLRINYSKELLKNTDLTLGEIAGKSGYTDYFYFIRVFKKITGKSPGQFRSSSRE
ncbi:MAG TPA: response regulator [Clostridiaceae bacterium]|nr:response regulator [Clostridiaceae bacterium]